jgi:hypothetical protein
MHHNVTRLSPSNMGWSHIAFDGQAFDSAGLTLLTSMALIRWLL